ncbi:hypothetical protein EST38_g8654 [Candolleomyces aberdarensis]|uniref:Uncharacterized protein n=1 Tax=Candolleomyces aberdarensis TaxID=2316362 RepID=A0A4V1Q334_9AGAR|nr:hypothetical protein EST38_g8654 [Candolleomyces aberdarensis]
MSDFPDNDRRPPRRGAAARSTALNTTILGSGKSPSKSRRQVKGGEEKGLSQPPDVDDANAGPLPPQAKKPRSKKARGRNVPELEPVPELETHPPPPPPPRETSPSTPPVTGTDVGILAPPHTTPPAAGLSQRTLTSPTPSPPAAGLSQQTLTSPTPSPPGARPMGGTLTPPTPSPGTGVLQVLPDPTSTDETPQPTLPWPPLRNVNQFTQPLRPPPLPPSHTRPLAVPPPPAPGKGSLRGATAPPPPPGRKALVGHPPALPGGTRVLPGTSLPPPPPPPGTATLAGPAPAPPRSTEFLLDRSRPPPPPLGTANSAGGAPALTERTGSLLPDRHARPPHPSTHPFRDSAAQVSRSRSSTPPTDNQPAKSDLTDRTSAYNDRDRQQEEYDQDDYHQEDYGQDDDYQDEHLRDENITDHSRGSIRSPLFSSRSASPNDDVPPPPKNVAGPSSSGHKLPLQAGRTADAVYNATRATIQTFNRVLREASEEHGIAEEIFVKAFLRDRDHQVRSDSSWNTFQQKFSSENKLNGDAKIYSREEVAAAYEKFRRENDDWQEQLDLFKDYDRLSKIEKKTYLLQQRDLEKLFDVFELHAERAHLAQFEVVFAIVGSAIFQNDSLNRLYFTPGLVDFSRKRLGVPDSEFLGLIMTEACDAVAQPVTEFVHNTIVKNREAAQEQSENDEEEYTPEPTMKKKVKQRREKGKKPEKRQEKILGEKQGSSTITVVNQKVVPPKPSDVVLPDGEVIDIPISKDSLPDPATYEQNLDFVKPIIKTIVEKGNLRTSSTSKSLIWARLPSRLAEAGWCLVNYPANTQMPGETPPGVVDLERYRHAGIRAIKRPALAEFVKEIAHPDSPGWKLIKGDQKLMEASRMPVVIQAPPILTLDEEARLRASKKNKNPGKLSKDKPLPLERGRRLYANATFDSLGPAYVVRDDIEDIDAHVAKPTTGSSGANNDRVGDVKGKGKGKERGNKNEGKKEAMSLPDNMQPPAILLTTPHTTDNNPTMQVLRQPLYPSGTPQLLPPPQASSSRLYPQHEATLPEQAPPPSRAQSVAPPSGPAHHPMLQMGPAGSHQGMWVGTGHYQPLPNAQPQHVPIPAPGQPHGFAYHPVPGTNAYPWPGPHPSSQYYHTNNPPNNPHEYYHPQTQQTLPSNQWQSQQPQRGTSPHEAVVPSLPTGEPGHGALFGGGPV